MVKFKCPQNTKPFITPKEQTKGCICYSAANLKPRYSFQTSVPYKSVIAVADLHSQ